MIFWVKLKLTIYIILKRVVLHTHKKELQVIVLILPKKSAPQLHKCGIEKNRIISKIKSRTKGVLQNAVLDPICSLWFSIT